MRRPLSLALALLVFAASASPGLAARAGSPGTKQGVVTITISNLRSDATKCVAKVTGQYLGPGQDIDVGHYPSYGGGSYWTVGTTTATGGATATGYQEDASAWDRSHSLYAFTNGYYAILDTNGGEAGWTINNTCRNP